MDSPFLQSRLAEAPRMCTEISANRKTLSSIYESGNDLGHTRGLLSNFARVNTFSHSHSFAQARLFFDNRETLWINVD
jgi:hypothetical protein